VEHKGKGRQCAAQFPILEGHIVKCVDRENYKYIMINDFVLTAATEELIPALSKVPAYIVI